MKKVISLLMVGIVAWTFASWVDVVADNFEENPKHSKYNLFCMMVQEEYQMEGQIIDCGAVLDTDGNVWEVDTDGMEYGEELTLTMNDRGTPQIEDDEVVGLSRKA